MTLLCRYDHTAAFSEGQNYPRAIRRAEPVDFNENNGPIDVGKMHKNKKNATESDDIDYRKCGYNFRHISFISSNHSLLIYLSPSLSLPPLSLSLLHTVALVNLMCVKTAFSNL